MAEYLTRELLIAYLLEFKATGIALDNTSGRTISVQFVMAQDDYALFARWMDESYYAEPLGKTKWIRSDGPSDDTKRGLFLYRCTIWKEPKPTTK